LSFILFLFWKSILNRCIFLPRDHLVNEKLFGRNIHLDHLDRDIAHSDPVPGSDLFAVTESETCVEEFRIVHRQDFAFSCSSGQGEGTLFFRLHPLLEGDFFLEVLKNDGVFSFGPLVAEKTDPGVFEAGNKNRTVGA
jgi:hypothetical protein